MKAITCSIMALGGFVLPHEPMAGGGEALRFIWIFVWMLATIGFLVFERNHKH